MKENNTNKSRLFKIIIVFVVIIIIIFIIFAVRSKKEQKNTFRGYECTTFDCSGHKAGYEWAANKNIEQDSDCGGSSQSFIEGCKAYVKAFNDESESEKYSDGACVAQSEIDYYSAWMRACNLQGLLTPKCEQLEEVGYFTAKYGHFVLNGKQEDLYLQDRNTCKCELPNDVSLKIRKDYNFSVGVCENKCIQKNPGSSLCNMNSLKI
ncbi:MAG: hypothetical protein WCO09_02620 [bacterium]